ncbi:MAG TPA: hypothetical protein VFA46_15820 [Actinomycetes bacterium]|nr:hypothetical protein [Actinomycetes bacterium]
MLDTPVGPFQGVLTVFCIAGQRAPTSHNDPSEEGVMLNVAGVINFNHAGTGQNIWVRIGLVRARPSVTSGSAASARWCPSPRVATNSLVVQ